MEIVFSGVFSYWSCKLENIQIPTHLVDKERPDVLEELQLCLQPVPTLLRQVHHVQHRGTQMGQGGDGLHFNCVPILQGVVQNPRSIYNLTVKLITPKHTAHKLAIQHILQVTDNTN